MTVNELVALLRQVPGNAAVVITDRHGDPNRVTEALVMTRLRAADCEKEIKVWIR